MEVTGGTTIFQVSDVAAAIVYYRDVLGFAQDFRYSDYAGITLGKFSLHLCAHHIWRRPVGGGAVFVYLEDADAYCRQVRERGAKIQSEPADQEYGLRDFVLSDPDGNVLTFASDL